MAVYLALPRGLDSPLRGQPTVGVDSRLTKASHPCGLPSAVSRAATQPPGSSRLPRHSVVVKKTPRLPISPKPPSLR